MVLVQAADCCIHCTGISKCEKLNCDSGCHKTWWRNKNCFLPTIHFAFFMRNKLLLIAFQMSEAYCPSWIYVCIIHPHAAEANFSRDTLIKFPSWWAFSEYIYINIRKLLSSTLILVKLQKLGNTWWGRAVKQHRSECTANKILLEMTVNNET